MSAEHRTVSITCQIRGGTGFCTLQVTKINGEILLDPQVDGFCVLRLDETATTQLGDLLGEWPGWAGCLPNVAHRFSHV